MADPFLGEIRIFGFNFAPTNWALCNGALMSIQQNPALFSVLGTSFGGNGTKTFGLPNLQSNVPVGAGTGPTLSPRANGQTGGQPIVTLTMDQQPLHSHAFLAAVRPATLNAPTVTTALARTAGGNAYAAASPGATVAFNAKALSPAPGNGRPHNNMMPTLTLNFCIALAGTFPQR